MKMNKKSTGLTKIRPKWLWSPPKSENIPSVLPKSKTARLALQAKLANIAAEKSISRAYYLELERIKALGDAMFKSGKALRYSIISSGRQILLRTEAARRSFEPGYRNRFLP